MDFSGPEPVDFANVRSLNIEFLSVLRGTIPGATLRQQLPGALRPVLTGLTDLQIQRLSESPFLLMSFRERDDEVWRSLASEEHARDLFAPEQAADGADHLIAAGLGFLWQLARRNPYAVRLISGASPDWCERLADFTLLHLMQSAACHRDLLVMRFAGQSGIWAKLLDAGLSVRADVRAAAQLSALQTMLTLGPATQYRRMRAAACKVPTPVMRIAEKP